MVSIPDHSTVSAFGASETAKLLAGGQGNTYVSGDIVFKHAENLAEAEWLAETITRVPEDGLRLEKPLRTSAGKWTHNGWSAWTKIAGAHDTTRWKDAIAAGRLFHSALAGVAKPGFMDNTTNPWRDADKYAWGEEVDLDLPSAIEPVTLKIKELLTPITVTNQLVHLDLLGNVLYADGLDPGIIDYSLYYRPADYSLAVVVIDSLDWHSASDEIFDYVATIPFIEQLLLRAELFRITTYAGYSPEGLTEETIQPHIHSLRKIAKRFKFPQQF